MLRSKLSAEERAHKKEITTINQSHKAAAEVAEEDAVDRLRAQEAELRAYQQRMHDERNESAQDAAELAEQVEQLNATLERLRSCSKSGLLTQVTSLQEKVRELGARRTLNQRRVSDANLADRRTRVAQEQAATAKAELREYGVSAEGERAATERADSLEDELFEVNSRSAGAVQ